MSLNQSAYGISTTPILKLQKASAFISLTLPRAMSIEEEPEFKMVTHELIDYSVVQSPRGFVLHWVLDYSGCMKGSELISLQHQIERYFFNGYKMFLTPRSDRPDRSWEVVVEQGYKTKLMRGGTYTYGHKEITIGFRTKYLINDLMYLEAPDPIVLTTVLINYPVEIATL